MTEEEIIPLHRYLKLSRTFRALSSDAFGAVFKKYIYNEKLYNVSMTIQGDQVFIIVEDEDGERIEEEQKRLQKKITDEALELFYQFKHDHR